MSQIEFGTGDTAETQKVTFNSTTDKHTKDDLVKSIGADANKYVVKEVSKGDKKK
ncbi:MAG: hypothetical protein ACR2OZ_21100 [Verrucomicrobiales bacterium]